MPFLIYLHNLLDLLDNIFASAHFHISDKLGGKGPQMNPLQL